MIIFIGVSTKCCLVTLPGDTDTDQHWFRVRPGSCRHQAIVWTNDDLLLMGAKEWNLIQNTLSFKKMHLIFSITTLLVWCCLCEFYFALHYNDIIMGTIASQITSLTIVYLTVYSDADQRKHQICASLAFMRGIHRGPVNSPHKWPVIQKMFPFDDVIMLDLMFPWNDR